MYGKSVKFLSFKTMDVRYRGLFNRLAHDWLINGNASREYIVSSNIYEHAESARFSSPMRCFLLCDRRCMHDTQGSYMKGEYYFRSEFNAQK